MNAVFGFCFHILLLFTISTTFEPYRRNINMCETIYLRFLSNRSIRKEVKLKKKKKMLPAVTPKLEYLSHKKKFPYKNLSSFCMVAISYSNPIVKSSSDIAALPCAINYVEFREYILSNKR